MKLDIKALQAEQAKLTQELQNEAVKYNKLQTSADNEREKLLCQVTHDTCGVQDKSCVPL